MSDDLLAIYLTDHLAGATGGSNRMRSLADHERSSSDGAVLATIASEIEQDRRTLIRILAAAQVTPRRYKMAAAWLVERAGLLKSNGSFRRSPLTSVLELEFLRMGVTGKIALWESLRQTDLRRRVRLRRAARARHSTPAGTRGRPRSPRCPSSADDLQTSPPWQRTSRSDDSPVWAIAASATISRQAAGEPSWPERVSGVTVPRPNARQQRTGQPRGIIEAVPGSTPGFRVMSSPGSTTAR